MDLDGDDDLMYETFDDSIETAEIQQVLPEKRYSDGDLSKNDDSDKSEDKDEEELKLTREKSESPVRRSIPLDQFGITPSSSAAELSENDIQSLYDGLEVDLLDSRIRANALFVVSIQAISVYEIERYFAEYNVVRCALLSEKTAVVRFGLAYEAAQALIGATKRLVRIRKPTTKEDGEIGNSDDEDSSTEEEEEGQVKVENGEDVVVIRESGHKRKKAEDTVELDIHEVKIPSGKWRVVTSHIPEGKHVFVRLANGFQVRQSMISPFTQEVISDEIEDHDQTEYDSREQYKRKRVRPGLNVFDDKGRELDWDYEHDTRFYEKKDTKDEEENSNKRPAEEFLTESGHKIRSRGRGTKKFIQALLDDSD